MTKVGIRELKNRLSRYLRLARRGQTVLVTDRGKDFVKIVSVEPPSDKKLTMDELLQKLAAEGHLRLGTGKFSDFKPIKTKGKPASQMIIEDRR